MWHRIDRSTTGRALLIGALALLVGGTLAGGARAECVAYEDHLRWVRTIPAGTTYSNGLATFGNIALFVNGGVVDILDVSNPALTYRLNSFTPASGPRNVFLEGNTAYVGTYAGLSIYDVSDPASPISLGSVDLPNRVEGVDYAAGYLYAAVRNNGLFIIDVSDSSTPVVVGSRDTVGFSTDVAVSGSYAYFADSHILLVFDVSDPTDPTEIDVTPWLPGTHNVVVSGGYAYIGAGPGLEILDLSVPDHPVSVGGAAIASSAYDISISGNMAYVATFDRELVSVDISSPTDPIVLGAVGGNTDASCVVALPDYVLLGTTGALRVAQATTASVPTVGEAVTPGTAWRVHVESGLACVADGSAGLTLYDVTNPANPVYRGNVDTPGSAVGVVRIGSHACVADGSWGIQVVDVSNPLLPTIVGSLDTGSANQVATDGTLLYVANDPGFKVVDISDPTLPEEIGATSITQLPMLDVAISGDHAYLAGGTVGLRVVDISDPMFPVQVGSLGTPSSARGVAVAPPYCYIADWNWGLRVIDVTNPASPQDEGFIDTPGYAHGVTVAHDIAYVSDGWGGLQVANVSLPATPWILGSVVEPEEGTLGAFVHGDYVYCAEENLRIRPVQCTASAAPVVAGSQGLAVRLHPNPSAGPATVSFQLPRPGTARVRVFDAAGRLVRELERGSLLAGPVEMHWDGRDTAGRAAAAGVYFVRVEAAQVGGAARVVLRR